MTPFRAMLLILTAFIVALTGSCDGGGHILLIPGDHLVRGNGFVVEQSRAVGAVSGVELAGIGTLYIRQGPFEELVLVAEENLLPHLITGSSGGDLVIRTSRGTTLQPTRPVEYHLTVPDLDEIVLTGAGDIECDDLATGFLSIVLTGAGNIYLPGLDAGGMEVLITGVGDVVASGFVDEQSVLITGAGDYEAGNLLSLDAVVEIAGVGSATVRVEDVLVATITGSGSIYYFGDPNVIPTITGVGSIQYLGP